MHGILSKVETIAHLPLAINAAFATALVPAISSAIAKKDMTVATKRLSFSFFATMLLILPCAVGLSVIAKPILELIYPAASSGAVILQLTTISMIFIALNYIVNGGLYGLGKIYIPVIALAIGGIIKLILNIILISNPNPNINIYGAPISSIICQFLSLAICAFALNKHIKLDIKFIKHILKPIIASLIMGAGVLLTYNLLSNVMRNSIATIISIIIGMVIYLLTILFIKTLSKEDLCMIPYGMKVYRVLVKMKIYKES